MKHINTYINESINLIEHPMVFTIAVKEKGKLKSIGTFDCSVKETQKFYDALKDEYDDVVILPTRYYDENVDVEQFIEEHIK